ncbi:MAG TPA: DALR domain-containing protein, partial [Candidatus Cybelea sp.]|nr:DALR domain-containing protein [Candidatus Cybelea sp.]
PATDGEPIASSELDKRMEAALDDDMNTAAALAVLYDVVDRCTPSREDLAYWLGILGVAPDESWLAEPRAAEFADDFATRLEAALREAGVDTAANPTDGSSPQAAIERVVALRDEARRAKDWGASDRLRDALASCGVEVKDSKEGTTWNVAAR